MKPLAAGLVACVVLIGSGCGFIRDAKHVAEGIGNLAEDTAAYEAKFAKAKDLVFTATYEARSGSGSSKTITLTQKPPKGAYVEEGSRLIDDGTNLVACNTPSGAGASCTIVGAHTDQGLFGATGFTFAFAPQLFLTVFRVVAVSPEVERKVDAREIAGQASDCESLTKVRGEDQGEHLEVCVTKDGVISYYDVGDGDVIELTRYETSADDAAFVPPATPQSFTIPPVSAPPSPTAVTAPASPSPAPSSEPTIPSPTIVFTPPTASPQP